MGGRRILTDDQVTQACELREVGLTYRQISERFAALGVTVSAASIAWTCLRNGADTPADRRHPTPRRNTATIVQRGGHIVRPFTAEEDRLLMDMERQGLPAAEIARRLNRRRNSIVGRLATLARHEARAEG